MTTHRKSIFAVILLVITLAVQAAYSQQAYTETVLYAFTGGTDGEYPYSGLTMDRTGNLYGTTGYGGQLKCNKGQGCGTVFRIDKNGNETVLHAFTGTRDGAFPYTGLIRDAAGSFYGTTEGGGTFQNGTIFKLEQNGRLTLLHSFSGGVDGAVANSNLIMDTTGNLYGTTFSGGTYMLGNVFKIDATGQETVLYSFAGGADGSGPTNGLIIDTSGNLYGTTFLGGASGFGTVFKVDSAGNETILHSFAGGVGGLQPSAGVIRDPAGNLYGTTELGGEHNSGTVYKLDPFGILTVLYSFGVEPDGNSPGAPLLRAPDGSFYGTTNTGGFSHFGTVFRLSRSGETVLYNFSGFSDGALPQSGSLIRDAAGNFYGTTGNGGTFGRGVVFKLAPN